MIDFIFRANDVVSSFPTNEKWSLQQLSELTDTSIPHLLQYLNEGLDKEVDIGTHVSCSEVFEAINLLQKRYRAQIEERERREKMEREAAISAYGRVMRKVASLQAQKIWEQAFKTLCYFVGEYDDKLPAEYLTTLCSDIIRMGIRAKASIQEISRWLEKGVSVAMSHHSQEGVAEALDFIDAYGEFFLNEDSGKGPLLLGNILAAIEEPSARFELWENYKALIDQLYPPRNS